MKYISCMGTFSHWSENRQMAISYSQFIEPISQKLTKRVFFLFWTKTLATIAERPTSFNRNFRVLLAAIEFVFSLRIQLKPIAIKYKTCYILIVILTLFSHLLSHLVEGTSIFWFFISIWFWFRKLDLQWRWRVYMICQQQFFGLSQY